MWIKQNNFAKSVNYCRALRILCSVWRALGETYSVLNSGAVSLHGPDAGVRMPHPLKTVTLRLILHLQQSDHVFLYFPFHWTVLSTDHSLGTLELRKGYHKKTEAFIKDFKLLAYGLKSAFRHVFFCVPPFASHCLLGPNPYHSLVPCTHGFLCFPPLAGYY